MHLPTIWVTDVVESGPLRLLDGKAHVEIRDGELPIPEAEWLARAPDFDYILACVHMPPLSDTLIAAARGRLKGYVTRSVGINHIDLAAANRAGILCANTPGVLVDATADHTVGLIIAAARRYHEGHCNARQDGRWLWSQARLVGQPVRNQTLGIIGLGPIGSRVARTMRLGFDMRIIYWSRRRKHELERELGLTYLPLETVVEQADILTLHCALTRDTEGMLTAARIARMKSSAVLINTARGQLIDQHALVRAVAEGRIFGAAVDVTYPDPPTPDDPILHEPRIFVQPHIGNGDAKSREAMTRLAVGNLLDMIEGRRPRALLNPAALERCHA